MLIIIEIWVLDPSTYDKFGEVMRQDRSHRYNVTNLYLDIKKNKGVELPVYKLEGWLDPGNRRKNGLPDACTSSRYERWN